MMAGSGAARIGVEKRTRGGAKQQGGKGWNEEKQGEKRRRGEIALCIFGMASYFPPPLLIFPSLLAPLTLSRLPMCCR